MTTDFSAGWGLWCFTYYFKVTMGQSHFSEVTRKRTSKWGREERGRLTPGSSLLVIIPVLLSPSPIHGAHAGEVPQVFLMQMLTEARP